MDPAGSSAAAPNLANTHIRSHDSPITLYVQHPIPVPAPWEKNEAPLKPLKLTSKEAKKLRRRRRMADLQEKQDRVRMGLLPPDPPKGQFPSFIFCGMITDYYDLQCGWLI